LNVIIIIIDENVVYHIRFRSTLHLDHAQASLHTALRSSCSNRFFACHSSSLLLPIECLQAMNHACGNFVLDGRKDFLRPTLLSPIGVMHRFFLSKYISIYHTLRVNPVIGPTRTTERTDDEYIDIFIYVSMSSSLGDCLA
jgi:hypothetical protein